MPQSFFFLNFILMLAICPCIMTMNPSHNQCLHYTYRKQKYTTHRKDLIRNILTIVKRAPLSNFGRKEIS